MRYAYAITTALLLGGAATTVLSPSYAQNAQNEPGTISASAPKAGAPMSFADMVAKLQPAVVNIHRRAGLGRGRLDRARLVLRGLGAGRLVERHRGGGAAQQDGGS